MIDCGQESCYSCEEPYCVNGCYNFDCDCRRENSMASGSGCEMAYNCISFIDREMYMERRSKEMDE